MAISNVTPIELAAYVAGEHREKTEYRKKNRGKKNRKDPLFGGLVAYYSTSESESDMNKYATYGKNRMLV